MFASLASAFSGDSRIVAALAALVALIIVVGVAYGVFRLAFAPRLRPSGGARGRAPRLGVVDVFGLDGQRQLVIVRRDNIEHLLLLGGPNDLVVEPNIQRAANSRDGAKSAAPIEVSGEAPAPIPAPAAAAPRAAPLRRDIVRLVEEAAVPAASEVAAPQRVRTPSPTRTENARVEPAKPLYGSEPPKTAVAGEPPKPVVTAEPMKPIIAAEPVKTVLMPEPLRLRGAEEPNRAVVAPDLARPIDVSPPVKPVEPALVMEPGGKISVEPPRRAPAPARPLSTAPRPTLPPPITPLRPRSAPEAPAELVNISATPEVAKPTPFDTRSARTSEPAAAPKPASEADFIVSPAGAAAAKPKKDDAFYDLESLEAEMARLLGRDP